MIHDCLYLVSKFSFCWPLDLGQVIFQVDMNPCIPHECGQVKYINKQFTSPNGSHGIKMEYQAQDKEAGWAETDITGQQSGKIINTFIGNKAFAVCVLISKRYEQNNFCFLALLVCLGVYLKIQCPSPRLVSKSLPLDREDSHLVLSHVETFAANPIGKNPKE